MDTLLQSQVFFLISSVGFVTLWILIAIFLFYLIRITRAFSRIIKRADTIRMAKYQVKIWCVVFTL